MGHCREFDDIDSELVKALTYRAACTVDNMVTEIFLEAGVLFIVFKRGYGKHGKVMVYTHGTAYEGAIG